MSASAKARERSRRHGARAAAANAARSANTCGAVAAGRLRRGSCLPLPVSTRTGCAPAAAAACEVASARRRPCGTSFERHVEAPRDLRAACPGLGLRQSQPASAACGQKKNASMRPADLRRARAAACRGSRSACAMSNRPRADARLVGRHHDAIAGLVRRAIASRLPGIGLHSSGDLMYWSLSWLMVPSRSRMMSFMRRAWRCRRRGSSRQRRSPAARGGCGAASASSAITITSSKNASTGGLQHREALQVAGVVAALERGHCLLAALRARSNRARSAGSCSICALGRVERLALGLRPA